MKSIKILFCITLMTACSVKGRVGLPPDDEYDTPYGDGSPVIGEPAASPNKPAGTITSSGGYVYGYQQNPWFLGNVKSVNYCIDMDEANFGPKREEANASIQRAVGLWKIAFSAPGIYPTLEVEPADALKIGQQDFNLVSCESGTVDIRFQFGKLTDSQRATLVKPTKYVASAVQTEYDEEQLRGKGFIYVAAEKGSLRPEADDLAEDFLSHHDHIVLDMTLVHELGHVFGVPHQMGTAFPMGESFCEQLVTTKFRSILDLFIILDPEEASYVGYSNYRELLHIQMRDLFRVNGSGQVSLSESELRVVLGINLDLSKESEAILTAKQWSLSMVSWFDNPPTNPTNPTKHTKVRELVEFKLTMPGSLFREAIFMRLPKGQKVFRFKDPDDFGTGLPGTSTGSFIELPLVQTVQNEISGEMTVLDTGKVIPVSLKTRPTWLGGGIHDSLQVQLVIDGRIIELF